MEVYQYHPKTKEYLMSLTAAENPLEEGKYLIPAHSVPVGPPKTEPGTVAVYNDGWSVVEDHRGEVYYDVDGQEFKITELGPVPDELLTQPPPPTQEELYEKRKQEIYARLSQIDRESIRPLRAKLNGTNTQADDDKLAGLESEAQTLRDELAAL